MWDEELCIQCGKCVMVCPHATIRAKVYEADMLTDAPATFKAVAARWKDIKDRKYTLQVAPEDCTGCALCVEVCPAKSKTEVKHKAINMAPQPPLRESEAANWDFFLSFPTDRKRLSLSQVKDVQLLQPLFEFSGACSGCGETPYMKLMTQLFGDRCWSAMPPAVHLFMAETCPPLLTARLEGRGPSWSNSLFEDNAEFGLGMRLAIDEQTQYARELVTRLGGLLGDDLAGAFSTPIRRPSKASSTSASASKLLKEKLAGMDSAEARDLLTLADSLVKKSVWIVGGDGWAYDIGYGGLDHVLASGRNVNVLVLDTEVYSNTGGRCPSRRRAARSPSSRPAASRRQERPGHDGDQLRERLCGPGGHGRERHAHGEGVPGSRGLPRAVADHRLQPLHRAWLRLVFGMEQQKAAVNSGYWPLFRYNPELTAQGKNPFQLDSKPATIPLKDYVYNETRYTMLAKSNPEHARELLTLAQQDVAERWKIYDYMAHMPANGGEKK